MKIQSIDRAFDIIELLSLNPRGQNLSEISQALSLPISTVYRITADLVDKGYLDKNNDLNIYKIGLKFIDLSSLHLKNLELKTEASPILNDLAYQVGFPVFLATMIDHEVCYIDRIDLKEVRKGYSIIGQRRSLFTTSLGKALILDCEEEEVRSLIEEKGIIAYTPYSITNPDDFWKELSSCKKRGWSSDNQEDRLDFQCVGVPVYDSRNNIVAAISCAWDKSYFSTVNVSGIAATVKNSAEQISERLGSRFNS